MVTKQEVLELVGSTTSANAIKLKLVPALQKYFDGKNVETDGDLLEDVSSENTIVWTYGLVRRIQSRGGTELDVDQLNLFIKYFENLDSKQVRVIPKQFKECYSMILGQFKSNHYGVVRAHMLVKAAERLDQGMSDPQLTTVHAHAVEMCYYANCSLIVRPLLKRDYYKIDRNYESAKSEVLRFFYFAALLLIKEEEYARARDYLTIVSTATVQLPFKKDAHYKCQLVSLLVNGQFKDTPFRQAEQATPAEVSHKEALFYSMFANNVVRDRSNDELLAGAPAHLKENGDYQLMQLCVERKRELTLAKQQNAFASLRMKDLPSSIARNNEEEAEKFVTHLLMRGKVDGFLTHTATDTILEFPPTQSQPAEYVAHLEELIEQVAEVSQRLDTTGRHMITKPSFSRGLKAIARGGKEKQRGGGGTYHDSMEGGMGIKRSSLHGGRGQRRRMYEMPSRDDSMQMGADSSDEEMISS